MTVIKMAFNFIDEHLVDFSKKSCFQMRHIMNLVAIIMNKIVGSWLMKIHESRVILNDHCLVSIMVRLGKVRLGEHYG